MTSLQQKNYTVSQIKGSPVIGCLGELLTDPLGFMVRSSRSYGDIICFHAAGQKMIQVNHPDIVRHILTDNYKNYKKNKSYIRFEAAGGLGLITSYGEKWKRDRKIIQPLFHREVVTHYHYEIANEVGESYKQKWLSLTKAGPVEINMTREMAAITTEVIMKVVFGRGINEEMVKSLHQSYDVMMDYLKNVRIFPTVDLRKTFYMPSYLRFKAALHSVESIIRALSAQYRQQKGGDRRSMIALLLDAQQNDPDYFNDNQIRDHCITMIFAGFETTSVAMQWMWYVLDDQPDIVNKLRKEIIDAAPCTATEDSNSLAFETLGKMNFLTAAFRETLRLYPPLWVIGREPIEDDYWGNFKVGKGTAIALPQCALHSHPKWWDKPENFIPERFLPISQTSFNEGAYFPFSHGPRKCSGYMFAEMEAKTIMAKLLPLFDVVPLNKLGNEFLAGMSLKLKSPLQVRISRAGA